jgi:F-box and WD-40 domain protein CDC4
VCNFREGDVSEFLSCVEDAVVEGWQMVKGDSASDDAKVVGLHEVVERFGKKRSLSMDITMEGVEEVTAASSHPRKRPRATHPSSITINAAAPPSPLSSPTKTPPQSAWLSASPSGASSPQPQAPIQLTSRLPPFSHYHPYYRTTIRCPPHFSPTSC